MMGDTPATPEKGASKGVIDLGGGFVADFSDLLAEGDTDTMTEAAEGNADNATLEGEEVKGPAKEEPKPEPEKPAEKAEPEKAAESPAEPETFEFKIKYRGEEITEKLTKEQIVARLQMSKDYTVKTEELSQKRRDIEAVEKLAKTPWFKETYEEAIRNGTVEATPESPTVDPFDKYEFEKRRSEPDFEDIRSRMREYSLGLPEEAQEILKSNHKVFIKEYDRFAEQIRKEKVPSKPAETPKLDDAVAKRILASKEVSKANAVVEKPGVGAPDVDPGLALKKQLSALRREAKEGNKAALHTLAFHAMYGELPQ